MLTARPRKATDMVTLRCPRCRKLEPCNVASLRNPRTAICPACGDSELEERLGSLPPWSGSAYWNPPLRFDEDTMANPRLPESRDPPEPAPAEFSTLADGPEPNVLTEFWQFLAYNKKWGMIPILAVLALVGLLVMLGSTGAAPFIYPLF